MNLVEALHTVRSWRNWLRENESRPLPDLEGSYWIAKRQLNEAVDALTPQRTIRNV